jgi:hypothetical protein
VSINVVGHGFGPNSKLALTPRSGAPVELPAPGRGVPLTPDGAILPTGNCVLPGSALGPRDCLRQTAVDMMQLIRAIRAGVDLDGDGAPDLDGNRIYYLGQSFGAMFGTLLNALEPNIRAAVLNVGGGSVVDIARLTVDHSLPALFLAQRGLLNNGNDFNDNYVFRNQPVRINNVPLAPEIQDAFEVADWLGVLGDPLAYARHLRTSPLPGGSRRKLLFHLAKGDMEVSNPTNSNLIRAADGQRFTRYYRADIARAIKPELPLSPHRFMTMADNAAQAAVSRATQIQVAGFFLLDGNLIPDVNLLLLLTFGRPLFEIPDDLPDTRNF